MSGKKKYIVKVIDKTERAFHVEAYNPTQARAEYETLVKEVGGSIDDNPIDRVVRVKLDAPPKTKAEAPETQIGESGESKPEKKKQKK
jgi:cell division protein FtsX